ncbi:FeoB small GTPase domain-containing protein [Crassaminicella indica]|uniref:50S ribosome-binding GTPase n=1 Tax=Crassaminicella indica TaxID=2855394 RepID=A0ABX8RBH2_9CLOT|nr:50S ribosome-binding GTPase [Crassaminicella indica]
MGLTCQSCGKALLKEKFNIRVGNNDRLVIALAGNPNVGKSTVFNALTGLKQHTGNWPGKTVSNTRGSYKYKNKKFVLVDLPGTYSLLANSVEEQVARDFICFGKPDATVVVTDATCLERNLNLVLQVMELTDHVILCVNLMDEAKRKGIFIDTKALAKALGIPVVGTSARSGEGLIELMDKIHNISIGLEKSSPKRIVYPKEIEEEIKKLIPHIKGLLGDQLNPRWVALKILEGDKTLLDSIQQFLYTENCFKHQSEVACVYE